MDMGTFTLLPASTCSWSWNTCRRWMRPQLALALRLYIHRFVTSELKILF